MTMELEPVIKEVVQEIWNAYDEGDITEKGAVKKLRPYLADLLTQSQRNTLEGLDVSLLSGDVNEKEFFKNVFKIFFEFMNQLNSNQEDTATFNECKSSTNNENNKNIANGSVYSSHNDSEIGGIDDCDKSNEPFSKISIKSLDILTGNCKDSSTNSIENPPYSAIMEVDDVVCERKQIADSSNAFNRVRNDKLMLDKRTCNGVTTKETKVTKQKQRSIADMFSCNAWKTCQASTKPIEKSNCTKSVLLHCSGSDSLGECKEHEMNDTKEGCQEVMKQSLTGNLIIPSVCLENDISNLSPLGSKLSKNMDMCQDDRLLDDDMDSDEVQEDFEGFPAFKRIKMAESERITLENKKNNSSTAAPSKARCPICRQVLDSDSLCMYEGHPDGAVEEFIALTDSKLSLFTGEEDYVDINDERPQHKLTDFTVYDKEGHICPFDSGLIERNVLLYTSGHVKPIYSEDPTPTDGVPVMDIGPINEWWISGFDGGEKVLLGFSTGFAEYVLMQPSVAYRSCVDAVMEKIHLSKLVIEFLYDNEDGTYEDLLHRLQTAIPPPGVVLSEDSLLRHAQFVCDQVHNFDVAGDGTDALLPHPCLRTLVDLAGVTLGKSSALKTRVPRMKTIKKMPKWTKATTTALVRECFDKFFAEQIDDHQVSGRAADDKGTEGNIGGGPRRVRCGMCEPCLKMDCGACSSCKDMIKFGGSGKGKQCCKDRKCPNMMLADNFDDNDDFDNIDKMKLRDAASAAKTHRVRKTSHSLSWIGEPCHREGRRVYYSSAKVNNDIVSRGDCVQIEPDLDKKDLPYIARVVSLWQDPKGEMCLHADWYCRGRDTILGQTSDPQELFVLDDCEDIPLASVVKKVRVVPHHPPPNWSLLGGVSCSQDLHPLAADDTHSFYCQLAYVPQHARFVHFSEQETALSPGGTSCPSCQRIKQAELKEMCVLGDHSEDLKNEYSSVRYMEQQFNVGDAIFVHPSAYGYKAAPLSDVCREERSREVDEELYPEYYRITSDRIKGSNHDTSEPFRVACIVAIKTRTAAPSPAGTALNPDAVTAVVRKYYRPEDTHRGQLASHQAALNALYWSAEEASVPFSSVCGKCSVTYSENLTCTEDEFFLQGPHRFVFTQSYDPHKKELQEPPKSATKLGAVGKGKGKGKGKSRCSDDTNTQSLHQHYPEISRRLRTLDVFSGCGGLSEGFHQAGIAESCWAIEVFEPAANAYKLNNPNATVFTDDCNLLLKMAIEGTPCNSKGQRLPQKGDVELLCGGPPCQGFSGMNRFNSRQYSQFKNSLVASYLSYCDYYRPRFFLLENVRNFVSYKCAQVLQLTLCVLVKMGYQCTFGILQAGSYGVAQTRRRAIVLAAAPGEQLPLFPEPLHSFAPRACSLSAAVGDVKYQSNCRWTKCGPLRTITVRDTMSDLQPISNGGGHDQVAYTTDPESHLQRLLRGRSFTSSPLLLDHVCKSMSALVEARMRHVPTAPGADWRMLPNKIVRLSDGSWTKKLEYNHDDHRNGRSSEGCLRGVCSCASGKGVACDPLDRQHNTLIPWCLPHTANRHNHWAGLYGRLEWQGFFSTTVTNPEPMGKQGRVLHPEQHRVVSVRECARSQGFPDSYRFYGSLLERHRQVGNAVPPPMARAIGLEIRKCVAATEEEQQRKNDREHSLQQQDGVVNNDLDHVD